MSEHMKTAEEIIAYLEAELAEASEIHKQAQGNNAQEALFYLIKKNTITGLLEGINDPHVEEKLEKPHNWRKDGLYASEEVRNFVRMLGY